MSEVASAPVMPSEPMTSRRIAPLVFTSATPGDARDLVALHGAVAQSFQQALPGARRWRVPSAKQVVACMKTTETILAREDDLLVATFRLDPARGFCGVAPFTEVGRFVYLLEMAVRPSHQRRGIGRLCLEAAERWARSRGANALRLDTNDDAARASAFYAACGYRMVLHHAQTLYFERVW